MSQAADYPDLYFTREQLMLSPEETLEVAKDLMNCSPPASAITDTDRAFVQRALLIVVDKSEKTTAMFDVFASFMTKAPSGSVLKIAKSLAKRTARRWFKKYIDDTPKYSAVGRAGFLYYSAMPMEWRVRVATGDVGMITNYLLAR
ncbi:hypothetical protein KEU06_18560 [Pseudaminobacter sp. 19-2017]|uniref:Uncharacterized protein n=1 Tax=Pseudaminobacter soli (ex Zhang et al. 2022) TaxID=2831468 RepID=A0A942E3T6_9HYPH|nr:hypothetical protein [Pseudaminobacter soli]MBS3650618.1 hypothetical protein [Pseudaminobacter soli]